MADRVHVVAAAPTRAGYGAPEQARDTSLLLLDAVLPGLGEASNGTHVVILGESEDVTVACIFS